MALMLTQNLWRIEHTDTRQLRLHINDGYNGRILQYNGWSSHADLSSATTAWTGAPTPIKAGAKWRLMRADMGKNPSEGATSAVRDAKRDYDEAAKQYATKRSLVLVEAN
ncbi:MAG: hypothetical protein IIC82_08170 [Chloroflexi bacterium]|nr:hypothetical protein [Chloroflexota bacterium]